MDTALITYIDSLDIGDLSNERKINLNVLSDYIQDQLSEKSNVSLNFICTHNSRRSQFAQVWAQTMATYFKVDNIYCYSGGTEVTAIYPGVINTLEAIGFTKVQLSEPPNPVWALKSSDNAIPIICFSKVYNNDFNPRSAFAAVMTCSSADTNCPFIPNAKRISITYEDPKISDGTGKEEEAYAKTCEKIASEMKYIFSQLTSR